MRVERLTLTLSRTLTVHALSLCSSWVIVLGCSATADRPEPDAGPTADGGGGGGAPTPVPTTITLENHGSAPLIVGNQCGGTFLVLEHDGEEVVYDRSCACSCDAPDACGCPAICLHTQELVVPGKSASIEWDGLYGDFGEDASCFELAGFERGEVLTATACWNQTPEGQLLACESSAFAYEVEREVTITAEHHSAARTPAKIVLDNQSGGAIQIVTDSCGAQGWFELARPQLPPLPEGESVTLAPFCPCSCDADFELAACPVCGGCAEDVVETVEPGATHAFDWDGMFFYGYASGCSERYAMPAGLFVNAQVCFTRQGATERSCQPVFFTLGESDEVTFTVQ